MIRLMILILLIATTSQAGESRIMFHRVDDDGTPLGSSTKIFDSASGPQSEPRIAFFTDRYLVVWQEFNVSTGYMEVKASRIEMDGTVLDTTPISLSTGSRTQALPDVSADSTSWVVVWHEFDGTDAFPSLFAMRVNYAGTKGATTQFGENNQSAGSAPRISWSGDESKFLVAYTGVTSASAQTIEWTLLSTSLVATLPDQYLQPSTVGAANYSLAAMPADGWTMIVSGGPEQELNRTSPIMSAVHLSGDGSFATGNYLSRGDLLTTYGSLGIDGTQLLDNNDWPYGVNAISSDSTRTIGVWTRYHNDGLIPRSLDDGDLYAARIDGYDPDEAAGGTQIVATTDVNEHNPSMAGDGAGNLLVVYDREVFGSTEIYGVIVTNSSGLSAETPFEIQSDVSGSRRSQSAVAYGSSEGTTEFMAVWTEGWWGVQ